VLGGIATCCEHCHFAAAAAGGMRLAPSAGVTARTRQSGFSIIELLVVLAIAGVIAGVAMPSFTRAFADYRLSGDARALHNLLGVAKMRAAARFTKVRLYVDRAAETFEIQYWDKTSATCCWLTEDGETLLSDGIDFGIEGMTEPPPATQSALDQAPNCLDDAGDAIDETSCVVFNSRGIPIDANDNPFGNTAFYITDHQTGIYGITLSATPLVRLWWAPPYATEATEWVHK
jgi:prepilin-type N-terminal cleavage/methylation domain-containing protein